MLSEVNLQSAKVQLDRGYKRFGGWKPMPGFILGEGFELIYFGDPPLFPLAVTKLHNDLIYVYPHDWVMIYSLSGKTFEVSRMD
jgi:hypothetical protein